MTRVKICGLCRPADAEIAAAAGADYLGVILAPGGPRSRTPAQATEIFAAAGSGPVRVGVFVNPLIADVLRAVRRSALGVVQLHGSEDPALAERLREAGLEVWKGVRPRSAAELEAALRAWTGHAEALLLDGYSRDAPGGTGTTFDWTTAAALRDRVPPSLRLVAAGGLAPANVGEAIQLLRPDVVDVSSGVEREVAVKDPARVHAFVAAVRAADGSRSAAASRGEGAVRAAEGGAGPATVPVRPSGRGEES